MSDLLCFLKLEQKVGKCVEGFWSANVQWQGGIELLLPVTCRGNPAGANPALAATDSARDKPLPSRTENLGGM